MRQECSLILTKTARAKMEAHYEKAEQLFNKQSFYHVHIEREAAQEVDELKVKLIISPTENKALQGDVIVMHCLCKEDGFVVVNYQLEQQRYHQHLATNYRLSLDIKFITETFRKGIFAKPFRTKIANLPIAKERSAYVQKRIAGWEGYLQIQESKETQNDIEASYRNAYFNDSFTKLTLQLSLTSKQLQQIENYGVSFTGHAEAGSVSKINKQDKTITVELRGKAQRAARKRELLHSDKLVTFSNRATLIQLQRLRGGFKALANGLAVNPNLEQILFDKKPTLEPPQELAPITFHNTLNEYQQDAVRGALAASDIFTIQGPPGTGKTTVISEICLQNVRAGKRTLIASQSNLAVDNALGRLLKDVDTRILRFGRTESIEEEGRPFIEDNVGYYWLEQTLAAVQADIVQQPTVAQEQAAKITALQTEQQQLQQAIIQSEADIVQKNEAEQALPKLREQMLACKAQIDEADEKKQALLKQQQALNEQLIAQLNQLEQLFEQQQREPTVAELTERMARYAKQQQTYKTELAYQHVAQQLTVTHSQKVYDQAHYDDAERFIATLTTAERVARYFKHYGLSVRHFPRGLGDTLRSYGQLTKHQQLQVELKQIISELATHLTEEQYAMCKQQAIAKQGHFSMTKIQQGLHSLQDKIALVPLAQWQEQELLTWLQAFMVMSMYVHRKCQQLAVSEQTLTQELPYLRSLLPNVLRQERFMNDFIRQTATNHSQQQQALTEQLQAFTITAPTASIATLNNQLQQVAQAQLDVELQLIQLQRLEQQLVDVQKLIKQIEQQQQQVEAAITEQTELSREKNKEGSELQRQAKALKQLQQTTPEHTKKELQEALQQIVAQCEVLEEQQRQQPLIDELRQTWTGLLAEATDEDVSKIREMYVRHANVVGTTCVASARAEFTNSFDTFDTVIIDEVSKATPPELLLPMLKGKQIILVGDHHQLPPLLGDDTLEETMAQILQNNPTFEGKQELAQLLKESLFERLFKQLPAANKQMLAIQYRMHEQIMQSIAPFYADEAGGLQCGLGDSDALRDHYLQTSYFTRANHLVWLDTPTTSEFEEQRMPNGTSRFNEGELTTIANLLRETNEAVATAKQAGLLPQASQKSVGVISFYGEQVKRLTRLVTQELNLPHLLIRTGTVDKFQGMEMDIVVVSMVRNAQKGGDVGFAKDYRRLNVALSRARQLLVLVGSSDMFANKARQAPTRSMYQTLKQTVQQAGGLQQVEAVGVM
ncbi:AAA domain-containing protein [Lysinibacillus sp. BF-4]|uniref:AAA domain-containing protein n=1 Tax=Lysinibacillus sp. BF-4 TaxID=1473546 RepID=UPI0006899C51|nr:AAA domain-containing protein [Lysinibacillus sp. BF-4]